MYKGLKYIIKHFIQRNCYVPTSMTLSFSYPMKQLKTNIAASIRDIASIWKGFSLPKTPPTEIITAAAANPPLSILKHFCNSKERVLESSLAYLNLFLV